MIDDSRRTLASLFAVALLLTAAVAPASANSWFGNEQEDGQCSLGDAVGTGASLFWYSDPDCFNDNSVPEDLNTTDARETKTQVYGALASVRETHRAANDSRANTLQMSKTVARMEAKNAYIRALDNDSTETGARLAAHEAVDDFYSPMESQILTQWEIRVAELKRANNATVNATGVSNSYIRATLRDKGSPQYSFQSFSFPEGTYTLANGTTITTTKIQATIRLQDGQMDRTMTVHTRPNGYGGGGGGGYGSELDTIHVAKPYSEFNGDAMAYLDVGSNPYADQLAAIQEQEATVDSNVNTFVNNTYSAWEAGKINSSDLVDPYLAAREYGPKDGYQTWALRSLMSMGQASPQNLSQFGQMNVTDLSTGQTHRGILLSDGLPASGGFSVGNTYDAANLSGPQYVITGSETVELDRQFRVDSATNASGGNVSTVEYNRVRYRTTNITEYKQQMDRVERALAEIEARQKNIRNGGGGFVIGENSSLGLLVLGAGALLLLYGRSNGGNGGNGGFP